MNMHITTVVKTHQRKLMISDVSQTICIYVYVYRGSLHMHKYIYIHLYMEASILYPQGVEKYETIGPAKSVKMFFPCGNLFF